MTTTTRRPRDLTVVGPVRDPRTLVLTACAGALWSAFVGIVVVIAIVVGVWLASGSPTGGPAVGDAAKFGVLAWVAGHQVPVSLGASATFSLIPLGLTLMSLLIVRRAVRWALAGAGSRDRVSVLLTVGSMALACAAILAVTASAAAVGQATVSPATAAMAGAAIVLVAAVLVVARDPELIATLDVAVPVWVSLGLRASAYALIGLLAVAMVVCTASVALHLDEAARIQSTVAPTTGGSVGLLVLGLAWMPDALVWTASYLLGAPLSLAGGVTVSVFGTVGGGSPVAGLPPLPLLAAVPTTTPAWAPLLLCLPVVAGAAGGIRLAALARGARLHSVRDRLGAVAVLAGLCGLVIAGLAALSSGAAGAGRLAALGPHAVVAGMSAVALVGLGALVTTFAYDIEASCRRVARRSRG